MILVQGDGCTLDSYLHRPTESVDYVAVAKTLRGVHFPQNFKLSHRHQFPSTVSPTTHMCAMSLLRCHWVFSWCNTNRINTIMRPVRDLNSSISIIGRVSSGGWFSATYSGLSLTIPDTVHTSPCFMGGGREFSLIGCRLGVH
jgi:hypothetical protein